MTNVRISAKVEVEVPFHDVDAMQVVWHGHYFKYMEMARTALLRSLDYDYPQMTESDYLWPIIECQARFIKTVRYGMKLTVTASILEYENRLKIGYLLVDSQTHERVCKGYTVQVAVARTTHEMCMVSPEILYRRLGFHKAP